MTGTVWTKPIHRLLTNISFDFENFKSPFTDKLAYAHNYLITTKTLSHIEEESVFNYRSDWCHSSYALYPHNARSDKIYILHPRNELLSSLDDIEFTDKKCNREIPLCCGKDIFFKYKGNCFVWNCPVDENQLEICRCENDFSKKPDKGFNYKENMTVSEFQASLNSLLE